MTRFIPTLDGGFVNVEHIVTVEILQHTTGSNGTWPAGTWMVRVRTTIGWGTGGYGHTHGHLLPIAQGFATQREAQEWVVSNLNGVTV